MGLRSLVGGDANASFALVAAGGSYKGLFPAAICALIPCHSRDATCFEDSEFAPDSPALQNIDASVSMQLGLRLKQQQQQQSSRSPSPLQPFSFFPQGSSYHLAALLDGAIAVVNGGDGDGAGHGRAAEGDSDSFAIALNGTCAPEVTTLAIVGVRLE